MILESCLVHEIRLDWKESDDDKGGAIEEERKRNCFGLGVEARGSRVLDEEFWRLFFSSFLLGAGRQVICIYIYGEGVKGERKKVANGDAKGRKLREEGREWNTR